MLGLLWANRAYSKLYLPVFMKGNSSVNKLSQVVCLTLLLLVGTQVQSQSQRSIAPFQTSQHSYTLKIGRHMYKLPLTVTYTNHSNDSVYLTRYCGEDSPPEFALEKWDGSSWNIVLGIPIACEGVGGIPPITVAPGASYVMKLVAEGYKSRNAQNFGGTAIPGCYRLIFSAYTTTSKNDSYDPQNLVPLSQRASNSFRLRLP